MTNDYAAAFGRLMIATLFLLGGLGKIAAPAATQAYIASVACRCRSPPISSPS
jgi:uncharacterized membrane protein YphA (DoxX/SURF4 family)